MTTNATFDFSIDHVPEDWKEAQRIAPAPDRKPLQMRHKMAVGLTSNRVDLLSAGISGLALSVAGGVAWYFIETGGHSSSPILSLALGFIIAAAVRLGGGPGDADVRATVAFVFYTMAVLVTAYMIERHDFQVTYGYTPDLSETEYWLVRDRLKEPLVLLGWAGGLVLSTQISYLTRGRRTRAGL